MTVVPLTRNSLRIFVVFAFFAAFVYQKSKFALIFAMRAR
jgi:hypothetical protein